MTLIIRKSTVDEIDNSPNTLRLLEEYAEESAIEGLPKPTAKLLVYKHLENTGTLVPFIALKDNNLIGLVTILAPIIPHYGILVAVAESLFVIKEYRKTGAGIKLISAAEKYAKEIGSPGLLLSAPSGGDLEKILPRYGYRETNKAFFRKFP
jgi:GNAT superfamily N-acetyltransferase